MFWNKGFGLALLFRGLAETTFMKYRNTCFGAFRALGFGLSLLSWGLAATTFMACFSTQTPGRIQNVDSPKP